MDGLPDWTAGFTVFPSYDDGHRFVKQLPKVVIDYKHHLVFRDLETPSKAFLWNFTNREISSAENGFHELVELMTSEVTQTIKSLQNIVINAVTGHKDGLGGLPDVTIYRHSCRIPFFHLEVKKPKSLDAFNKKHHASFYSQMHSYLMSLKTVHGIQTPYGILSTYDEFRVFWLDKLGQFGMSKKLYSRKENYQEAIEVLASAIQEGYNSEVSDITDNEIDGAFTYLTPEKMYIAKLRSPLTNQFPSQDTTNFYILRQFRRGDGRAFRVCSSRGSQAVLKFADPHPISCLKREYDLWREINKTIPRFN